MELIQTQGSEINWILDFSPRSSQPSFIPVFAIRAESLLALTGFERRNSTITEVLVIDGPLEETLNQIWPAEKLAPLERLRFQRALAAVGPSRRTSFSDAALSLLDWPLELQNYFDDRQLALKSLRPLEFLAEWMTFVTTTFVALPLTSSQCREALDLLCDLKMMGVESGACTPPNSDPAQWMLRLRSLRRPRVSQADDRTAAAIKAVSWPRGAQAKWERVGDQGSISLLTKISSATDWRRLRENFQKLELDESLWRP